MKAIVRSEYGPPEALGLEEVPRPVPTAGEVLVRVKASSINMADLDYVYGRPKLARLGTGLRRPKNRRLGLDVAGVVEAIGDDVAGFGPGDEVIADMTAHGYGAFAEYVCAPEEAFAAKPPGVTFEEAATLPQAAVMALQGLRGKRSILPGQRVLINGAGGNVGPFAVQIARSFGAEVSGVEVTAKLDLLDALGVDHVIDGTTTDYTKTGPYDWILDVAPRRSIFKIRRALGPQGVYVMIPASLSQAFRAAVIGRLITIRGHRMMGMLPWHPFDPVDVAFLADLLESGKIRPVIDKTYSLRDLPQALRDQDEGRARGKLVVTI